MVKKVFKGIINGEEFDSVEKYNAKMQQLIQEGADIDASTQTKWVTEDEKKEDKCQSCSCTAEHDCESCDGVQDEVLNDFKSLFTNNELSVNETVTTLLDELTGDTIHDNSLIDTVKEECEMIYNTTQELLETIPDKDLLELFFTTKGEYDEVTALSKVNKGKMESLITASSIENEADTLKEEYTNKEAELMKIDEEIHKLQARMSELTRSRVNLQARLMHINNRWMLLNPQMALHQVLGTDISKTNQLKSMNVLSSADEILREILATYEKILGTLQNELKKKNLADEKLC